MLQELHQHGVVHGDLHGSNFMVSAHFAQPGHSKLMLLDFKGASLTLDEAEQQKEMNILKEMFQELGLRS